jgi:integrase
VRQGMIDETKTDHKGRETRRLSRRVINQRVNTIRRMFRWAVSEELVPSSVASALGAVDGLRQGRSEARETKPVKPVDMAIVNRVLSYCPPTVAAMIQVQLYTGMRSGELVKIRPVDLDTSGRIWEYRPQHHKTSHHGHERPIYLGPMAKKAIKPFLKRRVDTHCFSPAEAMAQRRQEANDKRATPPGQGNERGTNRKANPSKQPGDVYTTNSYRQALVYAIRRAREDGKVVPDFTPHQLRHTAATRVRKEYGLDAARAVLGQRSLSMADDYAELDRGKAMQAMAKLG